MELLSRWTVEGNEVAAGATATLDLPAGTTTVTLTVVDDKAAVASDEVSVTVEPLVDGDDAPSDGWD